MTPNAGSYCLAILDAQEGDIGDNGRAFDELMVVQVEIEPMKMRMIGECQSTR